MGEDKGHGRGNFPHGRKHAGHQSPQPIGAGQVGEPRRGKPLDHTGRNPCHSASANAAQPGADKHHQHHENPPQGDALQGDLGKGEHHKAQRDRQSSDVPVDVYKRQDYHWLDACPKDRQQEVFQLQLELAREMALPVVVHDREAHADTLAFLQKYRPAGVVHCFSGSWETAREILNLGMYIGLGGVVTFKNARHAVEVAKNIPLDRLVLETDAPYMAPVPFRSKRNDSSLIAYVAEKIGELRGIEPQTLLDCTAENARRLFGIG